MSFFLLARWFNVLRNEQHTGLSLNDVKHKTSHTHLLNLVVYTIHTSRLYSVHAVTTCCVLWCVRNAPVITCWAVNYHDVC